MIVCLDTVIFAHAFNRMATRGDALTRRNDCGELLRELFNEGSEHSMIIPTPVISELLTARYEVTEREGAIDVLEEMEVIWPLDLEAARLAGQVSRWLSVNNRQPAATIDREFAKVDCLIACIGLHQGADVVCTYNRTDFDNIVEGIGALGLGSLRRVEPPQLLVELGVQPALPF